MGLGNWTDTDNQELIRMWEEGKSGAEIGGRLGRSRNSILGRAHRLGLGTHPKKAKPDDDAKPPRTEKFATPVRKNPWRPKPPLAFQPKESAIVIPDGSKALPLTEVQEYCCRAIIGYVDGRLDQAICCGEPTTESMFGRSLSWCAYHHSIYFEPPKVRVR